MRILFLSHYFPPEVNVPSSRTFEHCREWARLGDVVVVVTCAPSHPGGRVYPGYRNWLWQREEMDGIQVIRLWTYVAPNRGVARRSLSFLSYLAAALVAAPFLPRADVVVSTSPQFFCGVAGYFVSRLKRAHWVLEVRDLWPEAITAVGALRSRAVIRLLEAIEGWAYRKADHIVPVTRTFCRHIEAHGGAPDKMTVISNGADLDFFRDPHRDAELERRLGLEGKFVVGYFGTLGMAHGLETVLEAADQLRDEARIRFLIAGDGAERARLCKLREERRLDNVIMLGQQPRERMPALWGMCDISLALMKRGGLFTTMIPGKLFEAMAMERPIILGFEGESRELVKAAGCGITIEPENAAELAAAVRLLAARPDLAWAMGRRGRRFAREHYNRPDLARSFRALLLELARQGPRRNYRVGRLSGRSEHTAS